VTVNALGNRVWREMQKKRRLTLEDLAEAIDPGGHTRDIGFIFQSLKPFKALTNTYRGKIDCRFQTRYTKKMSEMATTDECAEVISGRSKANHQKGERIDALGVDTRGSTKN